MRRERKLREEDLCEDGLAKIQQPDPQFTLEIFLQRVRSAFRTIQQAWSVQNLESCRAFISDGIHERFDLYIHMQQAAAEVGWSSADLKLALARCRRELYQRSK